MDYYAREVAFKYVDYGTKDFYVNNLAWTRINLTQQVTAIPLTEMTVDQFLAENNYYSVFTIIVDLKRNPNYYIVSLIIPISAISIVGAFTFLYTASAGILFY